MTEEPVVTEATAPAPTAPAPAPTAPPVGRARRRSRWDRDVKAAVAVLVGLVAIGAAIFGTLEADTSKQSERASVMSARLATQVFEATAVVSQISSFALNAQQDTIVTQLDLTAHILATLQANQDSTVVEAEDPIEKAAADRLNAIIGEMADPKRLAAIADAHTAKITSLDDTALAALAVAQGAAVDQANHLGSRSTLLVYALSLIALAGVLAGLAGVLRRGFGAVLALAAGLVGVVLAVGIGAAAMVS